MELSTVPHGAAAYRVSIPFTISFQLQEAIELMASRIDITPAQAFIATFIALIHKKSQQKLVDIHIQLPPSTAENTIPISIKDGASFHALADEVALNLRGSFMFPIHIRFNDCSRDLELELQQFSETLQPFVGYNPREINRDEMLALIENYRSLLTRFAALPELPLGF